MGAFVNEPTSAPKHEPNQPETTSPLGTSALPTEPFACPSCGQMLSPSVRVCVACKTPVDFGQVAKKETAPPVAVLPRAPGVNNRARFSWPIFFAVSIPTWIGGVLAFQHLGLEKAQLLILGAQLVSSAWVFYDAHSKRIPRPLRWGLGSLLLWIVIFPWYVSRRRTPEAPCPFVEEHLLLLVLLTLILVSITAYIISAFLGK